MQALGGEHDYYIIILYQYHPSRSLDRFQALSDTHVGYGPRSAHRLLKGLNDSKMSSSSGRVERVWYEYPYRAEDREKFPEFESELKDHLEAETGIHALLWHANNRGRCRSAPND